MPYTFCDPSISQCIMRSKLKRLDLQLSIDNNIEQLNCSIMTQRLVNNDYINVIVILVEMVYVTIIVLPVYSLMCRVNFLIDLEGGVERNT